MGIAEIAEYAGMSRQGISNMRGRDDSFPAPVAELKSGPVFLESEIKAFFEPRIGSPAVPAAASHGRGERGAPPEFDPLDKGNLIASVVNALYISPAVPLTLREHFVGSGLYCLYYSGDDELYAPIADGDPTRPICVGTTLGFTRASSGTVSPTSSVALANRLNYLARAIDAVEQRGPDGGGHHLSLRDFSYRCLVVDEMWARPAEAWIIQNSAPVWNCVIPGIGNHTPGRSRVGVRSRWDELHPGRGSADHQPSRHTIEELEDSVRTHFMLDLDSEKSRGAD
ncbi:Eco29kI family restriction endonuclease [Nocardia seriolae]|uniref:Eco29kI family restriction endonuclease n=2 Tax=Nocardia seriolae TaxID=37332 RepID=A0ABC9Z3S9_9NOCA|nr:Eco29kI family restriction endonuclease [Nocardia seriolae]APA96687.1 hypothetical protein NS506_02625 [Nocardia seriolae]QOW30721.1 Eco29kI family restriction endonuclease [Nocardia seriolae]WNJ57654.1 Eco29kI family restriction endonuclease [Nocardia seriolae]BEK90291.1 hypothetical protein NSERKGN1266_62420 [Nocardia seriolae]BEK93878.1 hypothetical protein NSER024013_17840 [Nocardia seriolae]